jgi:SAM-dependent methyltransferase
LKRTERGTTLDVLIRLFLIGVEVDEGVFRAAVAPTTMEDWTDLGFVRPDGTKVVGRLLLTPFKDLVVARDRPEWAEGVAENHVMGIGSSSVTLATATIRRPCRLTLDLGTGSGFQAFLAAEHSDRVMAVDRNPRAVRFAAMNARLNGLSNVECLEGNLFEPVEGQRFDLIVTNPPFVISPERTYIYRDSGMECDAITRTIIRQTPQFLAEGGFCQILCNWAHLAGQDWRERLAEWFAGTGCDGWVLCDDTLDAATYASRWIRHTERDSPERFQERFQRWLEYYGQMRLEAVSVGLICLRRRTAGKNWLRIDDGPGKMLGPAGDSILQGFELRDFLEAHPDDAAWLDLRLRASPDLRLAQQLAPADDGWTILESELKLARGLAYSGKIDPYMAAFVARCNGQHPLRDLMSQLAHSLGQETSAIAPQCLELVRRLVERGFLLPEAGG